VAENGQRHLIKKYANRKLYDTNTRRYITLAGISDLVRRGDEIQVVDRESGRDLTPVVLSQIVTSEERRQGQASDGIQERGQALLDYVRKTLNVPASLVSGSVERRVGDAEAVIDLAIDRALSRLNIPTQRDIETLAKRLDRLTARLDEVHPRSARRANSRPRRSKTTRTRTAEA
jgi:polyhydroxyalkanoate synthesis repressor PhaR